MGCRYKKIGMLCIAVMCLISIQLIRAEVGRFKIVGGYPVQDQQYPWVVGILAGENFCGGSLIHPQWVLTAAHCINPTRSGGVVALNNIYLVVGQRDIATSVMESVTHGAVNMVIHPNWDFQNNDIALIQLDQPVTDIAPVVRLNAENEQWAGVGTLASVMGWGLSHPDKKNIENRLRIVDVPILNPSECLNYVGTGVLDHNLIICAGYYDQSKDACLGDSGGPLIVPSIDGIYLAGLVSYGNTRCNVDIIKSPGTYAKISAYDDWIEHVIATQTVSNVSAVSLGNTSSGGGGGLDILGILSLLLMFIGQSWYRLRW